MCVCVYIYVCVNKNIIIQEDKIIEIVSIVKSFSSNGMLPTTDC